MLAESPASLQPTPGEPVLASSPLNVTASASGYSGGQGARLHALQFGLEFGRCCIVPSPLAGEGQDEGGFEKLFASPDDLYSALMHARSLECDAFDAHVAASIVAIAFCEANKEGVPFSDAAGLGSAELHDLLARFFPAARAHLELTQARHAVERTADEDCLLDLLQRCTTSGAAFETRLAAMIARRAQRPNHLWQDLGLRNRGDLSELMSRHFKPLAMRNTNDMKWKKFLYRIICSDASYTLCTAPSCAECDDFDQCFGEETGVSLLARARRAAEAG